MSGVGLPDGLVLPNDVCTHCFINCYFPVMIILFYII